MSTNTIGIVLAYRASTVSCTAARTGIGGEEVARIETIGGGVLVHADTGTKVDFTPMRLRLDAD